VLPAIDRALAYFEALAYSGQTIQIDGPEFNGIILWSNWNRSPSRPMSAEVEKAIETVRMILVDIIHVDGDDSFVQQFDLIVAALKEKV